MTDKMKDIVAIDGPLGAGKSSVAKEVARRLGFTYIDTGAMYRAVTLKAMRRYSDTLKDQDPEALTKLAEQTHISLRPGQSGTRVFLDGQDVSEEIRTPELTRNITYVDRVPGVRKRLVSLQQEMGDKGKVVMEGRDITTVVFPDAEHKFYIDASIDERARRRFRELRRKGYDVDMDKLKKDIVTRDEHDMNRAVSPLKKAPGAVVVDCTGMSIEDVVQFILHNVRGAELPDE